MASTDRLSFDNIVLDKSEDKIIEWGADISGIPLSTSWKNIGASIPAEGIDRKYFTLKYSDGYSDPYLLIKRHGLYYFNIYNAQFREGAYVDNTQIAWTCIMKDNNVGVQVAHYFYWPGSAQVPIAFKNDGILELTEGMKLRAMYSKSGIDSYNIYGAGYVTCQIVHIKDLN